MFLGKRELVAATIILFSACASVTPAKKAEQYATQEQWLRAVMELRSDAQRHPNDVEIRSSLEQYELRAAEYYYHNGLRHMTNGELDQAIAQFEQGLASMPRNEKLRSVLRDAMSQRQAQKLYTQALRQVDAKNFADATRLLQGAIELAPSYTAARNALEVLKRRQLESQEKEFVLSSNAPVTLNFNNTDLRTAFGFLSSSFGLNVVFDEGVQNKEVTLFAKDLSFREALDLMLSTTHTFYKKIGPNVILVAPDTKEKRGQYEDYIIRTFQLTNANAKEVADVLKGIFPLQKIVVNERMNTLTVRESEDLLTLIEKVVRAQDSKSAEVMLEVEILEVDRNKTEQLGFDFGSMITEDFPTYPVASGFPETLAGGTVTLPAVTFRYFKQNVNAKTLANPKIRVLNGKEAKIHIGDRVPLPSATIQEATGQIRTTFEYTDIGIRLVAKPTIYGDNSTLVKLALEVSSLGANLGTKDQPAYSIGTRNAETSMLLNDGETAIIGGLIRDDDRRNRVTIPGLGDIPLIGSLFSSKDDSSGRTDVLLTITPHVVRSWAVTPENLRRLYSGTAETYSSAGERVHTRGLPMAFPSPKEDPGLPGLKFDKTNYRISDGQKFTVDVIGESLGDGGSIPLEVFFGNEFLSFEEIQPADGQTKVSKLKEGEGQVSATIQFKKPQKKGPQLLARLVFKARREGVSYLMVGPTAIHPAVGEQMDAKGDESSIDIQ